MTLSSLLRCYYINRRLSTKLRVCMNVLAEPDRSLNFVSKRGFL